MSHHRRVRRTRTLVPAAFLVLAGALTACAGASQASPTTSAAVRQPALRVGIEGSSFTGVPRTIHPGTVTLTFANSGDAVHMAAIGRLTGGHSASEITAFLGSPQGQQGPPPWLQLVGGVDEIDPGHRGSWTGRLDAGSYVLLSFSPDAQGVPEVADGLLAPFTASGATVRAIPPKAGATVTLGSGTSLTMSALPAGATAIRLVNDGGTARTVDITAIRPGRTYDDVMREAQQGNGVPPSLIRLGGTAVPPHGSVVAGIEAATSGTTYVVFDIDRVGEGAITSQTVR